MKYNLNFKEWWKEIDKINFIFISTLLIIGSILSFSLENTFLFAFKFHFTNDS